MDYETAKSHDVYLIAEDNGKPVSLRTVKNLVVNVLDENDNSPKCGENMFLASVSENELVESFLQIKAVDADGYGPNSALQYSIITELSDVDKFSVDQYSGWLSLREALDFERKASYDLVVEVKDSAIEVNQLRLFFRGIRYFFRHAILLIGVEKNVLSTRGFLGGRLGEGCKMGQN